MWSPQARIRIIGLFLCSCLCIIGIAYATQVKAGVDPARRQTCAVSTPAGSFEIPDISQWSAEDFGEFAEAVAIEEASATAKQQLGFDPAGVYHSFKELKLGFLSSLGVEQASLRGIGDRTGLPVESQSLEASGELIKKQTLESLADRDSGAILGLADIPVQDVLPIADFLSQAGISFSSSTTIQDVIDGGFGALSLESISLAGYSIGDLPGLAETALGYFQNYQDVPISEITNLSELRLGDYPYGDLLQLNGVISRADLVFGEAENQIVDRVVSGSVTGRDGIDLSAVPCDGSGCHHVELGDLFDLELPELSVDCGGLNVSTPFQSWLGDRWIGKNQLVTGGVPPYCLLPIVQEPTGRPFVGDFKMVLVSFDEAAAQANVMLYMRFCCRGLVDLGCTPYFIPTGITWPITEEGIIFLGPGGKG
ncbi:MAG: hypothetical protein ACFB4I_03220 [Cyanophyceae cyanobacterium]